MPHMAAYAAQRMCSAPRRGYFTGPARQTCHLLRQCGSCSDVHSVAGHNCFKTRASCAVNLQSPSTAEHTYLRWHSSLSSRDTELLMALHSIADCACAARKHTQKTQLCAGVRYNYTQPACCLTTAQMSADAAAQVASCRCATATNSQVGTTPTHSTSGYIGLMTLTARLRAGLLPPQRSCRQPSGHLSLAHVHQQWSCLLGLSPYPSERQGACICQSTQQTPRLSMYGHQSKLCCVDWHQGSLRLEHRPGRGIELHITSGCMQHQSLQGSAK